MFHSLLSSTTGVTCSDKSHTVLLAMISYWFVVLFVFFYYCMIVAKTIKSVYTFTEVVYHIHLNSFLLCMYVAFSASWSVV